MGVALWESGENHVRISRVFLIFRPYAPVSMGMVRPGVGELDVPPSSFFGDLLLEIRNDTLENKMFL